jgi:hypothetical protein
VQEAGSSPAPTQPEPLPQVVQITYEVQADGTLRERGAKYDGELPPYVVPF